MSDRVTSRDIRNFGNALIEKWRFVEFDYSTTTLRFLNTKLPYNYDRFSFKELLSLYMVEEIKNFAHVTYGKVGFDFYVNPRNNRIIVVSSAGLESPLVIMEDVTREDVLEVLKPFENHVKEVKK